MLSSMNIFKGMGDFFSLDIGTKSIRVVQLTPTGEGKWRLENVGVSSIDPKIIASDSPESKKKLASAIMATVGQAGIKTKDVAIGLPSSKTFTTIIEMPKMSDQDLNSTLKYQADQYIPMPLDDAKYDWAVLGPAPNDSKKVSVLIASVAEKYSENLVESIDSIGFNVIAAEPDSIAMIRSLLPHNPQGAHIVIDVGDTSTDIVVTVGESPVLVRTLPMGLRTLISSITQNLNIKEDQATQFILKFGLAQDRLEGQVFRAIQVPLDNFSSEVIKSIRFYQNKYANEAIASINLSGYAGVIPQFSDYIAQKTQLRTEVTSPWHKVEVSDAHRQRIGSAEFEFATAVGLAERSDK